jgi:Domain of unknown function (DUF4258)
MKSYILTKHASAQQTERRIPDEWIRQTVEEPEMVLEHADKDDNTHYVRSIVEFGNRKLRVVVNTTTEPNKIVTLFFDRRLR